jgi:hypothetical protein
MAQDGISADTLCYIRQQFGANVRPETSHFLENEKLPCMRLIATFGDK